MTLTELKTKLNSAKTGTDINQVLFDWGQVLNKEISKNYPIIFWNIDFVTGLRSNIELSDQMTQSLELQVFCINDYNPEDDKIAGYDAIIADLEEYLNSLNTDTKVKVQTRDIPYELWNQGTLSVDRELGVSYTVTLELWC